MLKILKVSTLFLNMLLAFACPSGTRKLNRLNYLFCGVDENQNRESVPVQDDDQYVQLFGMSTISAATSSFSLENKIGEGGFGPVYQVTLLHSEAYAFKT